MTSLKRRPPKNNRKVHRIKHWFYLLGANLGIYDVLIKSQRYLIFNVFRVSNCAFLIFASLLNESLKEKSFLPYEHIFPLRVDQIWKGFVIQDTNRKSQVFPLAKWQKNMKVIQLNSGTWKKRVECMQHLISGKVCAW